MNWYSGYFWCRHCDTYAFSPLRIERAVIAWVHAWILCGS